VEWVVLPLPLQPVVVAKPLHQAGAASLTLSTYMATTSTSSERDPEISAIPLNSSSATRLVVTWLCFLVVDG